MSNDEDDEVTFIGPEFKHIGKVVTEGLGNAALRAEIADLRNEVEVLASRVAYLESKRGGR